MDDKVKMLEAYYAKNYDKLVKIYTRRADTHWNAEDVVQDAFTKALSSLDRYDVLRPFEGWFIKILENSLKDYMRSENNYGMGMEFDENHVEAIEEDHDEDLSPYLKKCIEETKRPTRDILHLTYVCGYTPREIVKRIGVNYRTCTQTLFRFKKRMVKEMGDES